MPPGGAVIAALVCGLLAFNSHCFVGNCTLFDHIFDWVISVQLELIWAPIQYQSNHTRRIQTNICRNESICKGGDYFVKVKVLFCFLKCWEYKTFSLAFDGFSKSSRWLVSIEVIGASLFVFFSLLFCFRNIQKAAGERE